MTLEGHSRGDSFSRVHVGCLTCDWGLALFCLKTTSVLLGTRRGRQRPRGYRSWSPLMSQQLPPARRLAPGTSACPSPPRPLYVSERMGVCALCSQEFVCSGPRVAPGTAKSLGVPQRTTELDGAGRDISLCLCLSFYPEQGQKLVPGSARVTCAFISNVKYFWKLNRCQVGHSPRDMEMKDIFPTQEKLTEMRER